MNDNEQLYWPGDERSDGEWPSCTWPCSDLDIKRRLFLAHAVKLKPKLKTELIKVRRDAGGLKKWGDRWHLPDPWCAPLLLDDGGPKPIPAAEIDRWVAEVGHYFAGDAVGELGESDNDFDDDDDRGIVGLPGPLIEGPVITSIVGLPAPRNDLRFVPLLLELEPFSFSPVLERPREFKKRVLASVEAAIKDLCERAIAAPSA